MGTYGHLIKLVRVKAGNFDVKDAMVLDELDTKGTINQTLMNEDIQQMKRINYKYCSMPDD